MGKLCKSRNGGGLVWWDCIWIYLNHLNMKSRRRVWSQGEQHPDDPQHPDDASRKWSPTPHAGDSKLMPILCTYYRRILVVGWGQRSKGRIPWPIFSLPVRFCKRVHEGKLYIWQSRKARVLLKSCRFVCHEMRMENHRKMHGIQFFVHTAGFI